MQIITDIKQISAFQGSLLSIGNFDGVHLGHQAMLRQLQTQAQQNNVQSVAMTFDPPPVALISPHRVPPRLSTIARKAELISKIGIDCLFVYSTNTEFLNLSAEEFFQQIVVQQFHASGMVEGENFFFGAKRQGNIELLEQFTSQQGISLDVLAAVSSAGTMISSTRIRHLISEGEIDEAIECLGHPYRLSGLVVSGDQRGRTLGFPTANLTGIKTLIPGDGVYAGSCTHHGKQYAAAINIGGNPTFTKDEQKIEVHLIGLDEDLYQQELSVDLLARCRDVKQFKSSEELQEQLEKDIQTVQQIVALS
ncbi:MAG: bifunctional riboflavin kinase/FAD synthetase [Planctomycetaceae bacterium]|nr:bifunctional riboflavin kinase/FAD synthetase [Planctomycetaceae bacterium]